MGFEELENGLAITNLLMGLAQPSEACSSTPDQAKQAVERGRWLSKMEEMLPLDE